MQDKSDLSMFHVYMYRAQRALDDTNDMFAANFAADLLVVANTYLLRVLASRHVTDLPEDLRTATIKLRLWESLKADGLDADENVVRECFNIMDTCL